MSVPVSSSLPSARGLGLARFCLALCRTQGSYMLAANYAEAHHRWRDTPNTALALREMITGEMKTAVAAGTTTDSDWAKPLAFAQLARDFLAAVRPATVLDKLASSMRQIPLNTRVPRATSTAVAAWVGQGAKKPATESSFGDVTLPPLKVAALAVVSNELVKLASPAGEALVRNDLVGAVAKLTDTTFLGSAAAVPDISPAGIANGVTPITSTGNIANDAAAAVAALAAGGSELAAPFFIMRPALAAKIAGGQAYPTTTAGGGTLQGIPVVTSTSAPSGTLLLIDASEVLLSEGNDVAVTTSFEAVVDLGDGALISLFAQNLTGILAERSISWLPMRAPASTAALVTGIA